MSQLVHIQDVTMGLQTKNLKQQSSLVRTVQMSMALKALSSAKSVR